MQTFDIIAISISSSLLIIYHSWFVYNLFRNPNQVVAGWTTRVRRQWVLEILSKKSGDILAVQTLRNWILAATFLATVSMFISFGLLQFLAQSARVVNPTNSLLAQILDDDLMGSKTLIILCCNFISFFSFTQSIRYFNHVGFTINIPMEPSNGQEMNDEDSCIFYETADHVANLLNVGARFFTLGMRGFYFSIPFTFWYFGSVSLLISTIVVLVFIFIGDLSDAKMEMSRLKRKIIKV